METMKALEEILEGFTVERILGEKRGKARDGRVTYYLVKYEGYDEPTWQSVGNLTNCQDKIDEFKANNRDKDHVALGSVPRPPHRVCEEEDGCECVVVNGCPCEVCYDNGEDEEIFDSDEDDEYAFMNRTMRIRPGCHRRGV